MTSLRMNWSAGRRIAEVYDDDGRFVAAIYPTREGMNGIHIVSSHFAENAVSESPGEIAIPGILVKFKIT